jgi:predicted RNase H-like HicB family nuclease
VFTKAAGRVVVPNHKGDIPPWNAALDMSRGGLGLSAATVKGMAVRNYIAIAEPSADGTWWISFPGLPGVTSAADGPERIAPQAQDALASAIEAGAALPPAIEDGVIPPYDLGEYHNPLVVLVPYAAAAPVAVA